MQNGHDARRTRLRESILASVTLAEAHALFSYDPSTGLLRWKVDRPPMRAGDQAGYVNTDGYRIVRLNGAKCPVHRLAWFMITGEWPQQWIDHIDRDRVNNRFDNLRLANPQANARNSVMPKGHSRLGIRGVSKIASGRYSASTFVAGKRRYLGTFDTPEQAAEAYARENKRILSEALGARA